MWTETLSTAITSGLFSVELGTDINPLPKSSMNNLIWLGVEINTDGEAVLRKQFNSVSNAFRAETVEAPLNLTGNSAATISSTNTSTSSYANVVHGIISSASPSGWSAAIQVKIKAL